jgi:UTP--glucose-1-phosphate uridylyltransferase
MPCLNACALIRLRIDNAIAMVFDFSKIRKVVVPAGGLGTRMLPASKVIPKEMLPVIDTPAIQLIVEEAVASGIEEVIIVTREDKRSLLEHFELTSTLELYLESNNRSDCLALLRKSNRPVRITIVVQEQPLGLGHAVLQAREVIGDEPFAVMLPDDIFISVQPCLLEIITAAERVNSSVVALRKIAANELSRFGVVNVLSSSDRYCELRGLVEKPRPDEAPSDLGVLGRYILSPDIFQALEAYPSGTGCEIQLTDGLSALTKTASVYGYEVEAKHFDLGDPMGFITAQVCFGLRRPDIAEELKHYITFNVH